MLSSFNDPYFRDNVRDERGGRGATGRAMVRGTGIGYGIGIGIGIGRGFMRGSVMIGGMIWGNVLREGILLMLQPLPYNKGIGGEGLL